MWLPSATDRPWRTGTAIIWPEELAEADGVTAEGDYADALRDEIVYSLEPDGTPVIETEDPTPSGRAWTRRPPTTGCGQPRLTTATAMATGTVCADAPSGGVYHARSIRRNTWP